jgi:hypothetical protein
MNSISPKGSSLKTFFFPDHLKISGDFCGPLNDFPVRFLINIVRCAINAKDNIKEVGTTLSVVFCGCETWSLTLREEHSLRVFRIIFEPKRDEVTGGWRKLLNEELHGLYSSPSIIRVIKAKRMRWVGHVARMGEVRDACNILVGKSEGKILA